VRKFQALKVCKFAILNNLFVEEINEYSKELIVEPFDYANDKLGN